MFGSHIVLMHVIGIKDGDVRLLDFGLCGLIKRLKPYGGCIDLKEVEHIVDPHRRVDIFYMWVKLSPSFTLVV